MVEGRRRPVAGTDDFQNKKNDECGGEGERRLRKRETKKTSETGQTEPQDEE